ncbi:FERM domain-containing protein 6-like [Myripristis murdjan]|uniref:FERM domain-containing protein 6-like n=1 Tax=Myripristis murdjan TaxID=586833 RepID=UPI001175E9B1|nr:FERM domain-containing protein 6-like [Myripristis murdjan]
MRRREKREVRVLLPDKQQLDCAVGVKARGRDVLRHVSEQLGVSELHLFGLVVLRDNEHVFLDLEQKLRKYFGKEWGRKSSVGPFILILRVQYYVESGRLIKSSRARRLYYAELRQKALRSQCRHQEALFFQLAASALQAELGDLEPNGEGGEEGREKGKHKHYFLPEDYFPSWLIKRRGREYLLRHGPVLHGELRGMSRARAILRFIQEASALQDGPVTFYSVRQEKMDRRGSVLLGVALKGVHVYQEVEGKQCLLYDFSWTNIDRLTFKRRRFEIHAVGSLCLPKLVYYTPSVFHSQHILRHVSDSHRLHISIRATVSLLRQLEDMQASQFYKEAYICDTVGLRKKLCSTSSSPTSSMSDCSVAIIAPAAGPAEEEEEADSVTEIELCVDEPEEVFVDDPAELSWLAELLHGASVDGPSMLPSSCWAGFEEQSPWWCFCGIVCSQEEKGAL